MKPITKVDMHDGSVLIVHDAPDTIWRHRDSAGLLAVDFLGGGTALLPALEVYMMTPWRRPRPVSATPEARS